jgi:hypothetical protein
MPINRWDWNAPELPEAQSALMRLMENGDYHPAVLEAKLRRRLPPQPPPPPRSPHLPPPRIFRREIEPPHSPEPGHLPDRHQPKPPEPPDPDAQFARERAAERQRNAVKPQDGRREGLATQLLGAPANALANWASQPPDPDAQFARERAAQRQRNAAKPQDGRREGLATQLIEAPGKLPERLWAEWTAPTPIDFDVPDPRDQLSAHERWAQRLSHGAMPPGGRRQGLATQLIEAPGDSARRLFQRGSPRAGYDALDSGRDIVALTGDGISGQDLAFDPRRVCATNWRVIRSRREQRSFEAYSRSCRCFGWERPHPLKTRGPRALRTSMSPSGSIATLAGFGMSAVPPIATR